MLLRIRIGFTFLLHGHDLAHNPFRLHLIPAHVRSLEERHMKLHRHRIFLLSGSFSNGNDIIPLVRIFKPINIHQNLIQIIVPLHKTLL